MGSTAIHALFSIVNQLISAGFLKVFLLQVLTVCAQGIISFYMVNRMDETDKPEMRSCLSIRRRRLQYRCWHRGSREVDLLLGRFADKNIEVLDESDLTQLEALLDEPDPDIWDWVVGRKPIPITLDHSIMKRLRVSSTQLKTK